MKKILAATAAVVAVSTIATAAHAANPGSISYLSQHTKLGVKIYADMSYIRKSSDGKYIPPTGYGFDVKRGYLTLDTAFDDAWSVRFRTDFNYKSVIGETNVYIKNLYAQRKFSHGVKLRIGVADMPWIPHMEGLYGYRYVEHVLIDGYHFGNSADWGLHLLGNEGKSNWQVSLVNGGGYKHPSRSKGMTLTGRYDYNAFGGMHFVVGGSVGDNGKVNYGQSASNTADRVDAAAVYEGKGWNLGLDGFWANDWNNVTTPYGTKSEGVSLFGSYSFRPKWAVFARFDFVQPCRDLSTAESPNCYSSTKSNYANAGIQYQATKQVKFALVYKYNRVENGTVHAANGHIGGTDEGRYQELGVFMQAAF